MYGQVATPRFSHRFDAGLLPRREICTSIYSLTGNIACANIYCGVMAIWQYGGNMAYSDIRAWIRIRSSSGKGFESSAMMLCWVWNEDIQGGCLALCSPSVMSPTYPGTFPWLQ